MSAGPGKDVDHEALARGQSSSLVNGEDHSARSKLRSMKSKAKRRAKSLFNAQSPHSTDDDDDDDDDNDDEDEEDAALHNVSNDPAFHPTCVKRKWDMNHSKTEGPVQRTKVALEVATTAIAHPRKTIVKRAKRTAANKISDNAQVPRAAQTADIAFLEYERELARSKSSDSAVSRSGSEDQGLNEESSKLLEQQRDSLRVAWVTSRTKRVRVIPKGHITYPRRADFLNNDSNDASQTQWLKWMGHLILYYTQDFATQYVDDYEELPFDIDQFRAHVERLVIASGPWQTWFMDLRTIYRWEDPKRTGKYFAVFLLFWYINHVMSYFWGWILLKVSYNRFYSSSIDSLRAAAKRSVNHESAAFQLGEMIDRHGRDEWIEPFMEEIGPYAQVQVNDLANILEVCYNFYAWKSPKKTAASLVFFLACLLVALLADTGFCMKVFWFIAGMAFFTCWPIASLYPRYRLLVSPFKWVLWDIPTHAEWSFQYLRRQAQVTREAMISKRVGALHEAELNHPTLDEYSGRLSLPHPDIQVDGHPPRPMSRQSFTCSSSSDDYQSASSSTSLLSNTDFLSFRAVWSKVPGRLIIYPNGVRFVRTIISKEMWRVTFSEMVEMWKLGGSKEHKLRLEGIHGRGVLCLRSLVKDSPGILQREGDVVETEEVGRDGATEGQPEEEGRWSGKKGKVEKVWKMEVRERDEAFNCILGFSGLQWQSLQSEKDKEKEMMKGGS